MEVIGALRSMNRDLCVSKIGRIYAAYGNARQLFKVESVMG